MMSGYPQEGGSVCCRYDYHLALCLVHNLVHNVERMSHRMTVPSR